MKRVDKLEKVIKGLECCKNGFCEECPYDQSKRRDDHYCERWQVQDDAIELLKEKQPKKVKDFQYLADLFVGKCPSCGEELNNEVYPAFCGFCGQRISWKAGEHE